MNNNQEKQIQEVLNKTFKKANDKVRICCAPGCNKPAINSHILQKNGILNGIAQNGHILISTTDFFEKELFYFKRKGINETFTYKGFCAEHDSSIFSPIENHEIDFEDYKSQLLFAYRTILNEKVKKEVILDWHKYQKESKVLNGIIDIKLIDASDEQEKLGIKDISYFQDKIEKDLNNNTESFVFKFRYTKPVEICIASHFTFETTRERNIEIERNGKDFDFLTDIFISFFPIEGENVLLFGYLKEQESKCGSFVQTFLDCTEEELFKKISDLILCRCEVWACSENFYSNYIKHREEQINRIFQESAESMDEDRSLNFNIFTK